MCKLTRTALTLRRVKLNGTKAGGILGLHWRCAQVIHDASFDVAFVNAEFDRLKPPAIPRERLVDTLFWRGPSIWECRTGWTTLLALFRYSIDNSHRTKHGALLDAERPAHRYWQESSPV